MKIFASCEKVNLIITCLSYNDHSKWHTNTDMLNGLQPSSTWMMQYANQALFSAILAALTANNYH